MSSQVVVQEENNSSEGREGLTSSGAFMGAVLTCAPVFGAVVYGVNSLVEKLPHNTISDTQQMAAGFVTLALAHGALGKAFDKVSDYAKGVDSTVFLGRNAVAALVVSGGLTAIIMPQHLAQKAEQFDNMQRSAAVECLQDNLSEGTEVTRHRWADGFYAYECPSQQNSRSGRLAMPTGPIRKP